MGARLVAHIIQLTQQREIKAEQIHPVVLNDDDGNLVLVDCGDPGLTEKLLDNMREQGLSPQRLTHVILTHHDLDHMGGLSRLTELVPQIQVLASPAQAPYIRGQFRWLRLQEEDRRYLALPMAERSKFPRERAWQYVQFLPARVDRLISDGQALPFCGGCHILETPWHMPGHISLYFPGEKALVPGDALCTFGGVVGLNRHVDLCPQRTAPGLARLAELEVESVYAYHGGVLRLQPGEFQQQIKEIEKSL